MRVLAAGEVANARHVDLVISIPVPVGFRDYIGVMRVSHRRDQAEVAAIAAARQVEQFLACGKDDLVVEINLVGARARASLGYRVHGVVPTGPLLEARPVGGPAE